MLKESMEEHSELARDAVLDKFVSKKFLDTAISSAVFTVLSLLQKLGVAEDAFDPLLENRCRNSRKLTEDADGYVSDDPDIGMFGEY